MAAYNRAVVLRPDYADAYNNRGVILHAMKRFDEALSDYGRALDLQPHYADAFLNRSATLYELRRFGEALENCDRALALRPESAEVYYNRGNALGAAALRGSGGELRLRSELQPHYSPRSPIVA